MNRRKFIESAAAAAMLIGTNHCLAAGLRHEKRFQFCAFIKFLRGLSYGELAERIEEAGFDGVEATCRRKDGYLQPERVADELPRFIEALEKNDLQLSILTTDILRADDPLAEPVLRTAAKLGVRRYRLGFHRYDLDRPILPQLDALRPVFRDLAAMNREVGITGLYQNHSGAEMVGATIWDLHQLIGAHSPEELACVFDIRHATVEAGEAWPVYFNLMKPHLGAVSVKDFRWNGRKSQHVPLGDGQVSPAFFSMLRRDSSFAGPVSVHVEYLPQADSAANLAALARDFKMLQKYLQP